MEFDESSQLDTSQVDDLRGSSGGGGLGGRVAFGGGGVSVVGLIIYFFVSQLGGSVSELPSGASSGGSQGDNTSLEQRCATGADAKTKRDCEAVAVVNSLQAYWTDQFARSGKTYRSAKTRFFEGSVDTGCGAASSATGPFYCPGDSQVYIDLRFYQELEQRFGAKGGPFARAYVLAHEYGHHVQNLQGTSRRVRQGETGPTSGSVRLELQADCYSGVWANHATTTPGSSGRPLITKVTEEDIKAALDTAGRIGDDFIQSKVGGGQVDESEFTHGSSAQREKWFLTGYRTGDPARCDTFARDADLG